MPHLPWAARQLAYKVSSSVYFYGSTCHVGDYTQVFKGVIDWLALLINQFIWDICDLVSNMAARTTSENTVYLAESQLS